MIFGLDYTSGPSVAELKAAGAHFVCRYVSTVGNPKNIDAAEAKALHAAGIAVVIVFETVANRALAGGSAGAQDAHGARAQASAAGCPSTLPIYFAVDFDASEQQQYEINAYLRGAASVLGHDKTGVYGGYYVVKRALDNGACKYGWQTYAWSGGKWDPRAQIQQFSNGHVIAGHSVDYDHAMVAEYGQWRAATGWRWVVSYRDRKGIARVGRTLHPVAWASRHAFAFRHGNVGFSRHRA